MLSEGAPAGDDRAPSCGEGELFFGGACFWTDDGRYSWAEAAEVCAARRMALASVHSELEQAFIYGVFVVTSRFCTHVYYFKPWLGAQSISMSAAESVD